MPTLRRCVVAACVLAVLAGLAGCGGSGAAARGGLAIVVGAHDNAPPPALDGHAREAEQAALAAQSYLSVVVADGAPFVAQRGSLALTAANDVARGQQRQRYQQLVDRTLASAAARTPETDLLAALTLAARSIASVAGPHTIVVVDSGLSTAGSVNFTQPGLLDADPTELVAELRAARELPDLAGDRVVFQGLGDTAAPQEAPDNARRAQLVALWTAIVRASGATGVVVEQSPLGGAPAGGLPAVTEVRFSPGLTCTAHTVTLSGGDVAFRPDTAVFLDRAAASATLAPLARQMTGQELTAVLTGTTADVGNKAGQRRLSLERARAVLELMTTLGVPADHLQAVGLGSEFPGFVPDHDPAGHLIPAAAAANRKVTVELAGGGTVTCGEGDS